MVQTTTNNAREIYKLTLAMVAGINYAALTNNDHVLVAQIILGRQQVKNEKIKRETR